LERDGSYCALCENVKYPIAKVKDLSYNLRQPGPPFSKVQLNLIAPLLRWTITIGPPDLAVHA
jgi:hypothetical protein